MAANFTTSKLLWLVSGIIWSMEGFRNVRPIPRTHVQQSVVNLIHFYRYCDHGSKQFASSFALAWWASRIWHCGSSSDHFLKSIGVPVKVPCCCMWILVCLIMEILYNLVRCDDCFLCLCSFHACYVCSFYMYRECCKWCPRDSSRLLSENLHGWSVVC